MVKLVEFLLWPGASQSNLTGRRSLRVALLARISIVILAILAAGCSLNINQKSLAVNKIPLPLDSGQPFAFGNIVYDEGLSRVIVPAGEAGLFLVDPENREAPLKIQVPGHQHGSRGGFIAAARRLGSRKPYLFVANLSGPSIEVLDYELRQFVFSQPLAGPPESLVFISTTEELWVAEPGMNQIEIFKFVDGNPPNLEKGVPITELDQPVGLTFDSNNGFVYFNQAQTGFTTKYQALSKEFLDSWANGCREARDIAVDNQRGYLFIACREGKLVVSNPATGLEVISKSFGGDLYQVDLNRGNGTIYVPSGSSAILGLFRIAEATPIPTATAEEPGLLDSLLPRRATPTPPGRGIVLGDQISSSQQVLDLELSADTSQNANCVTSDDHGNIWVCDPVGKGLLLVRDPFLSDGN